MTETQRLAGAYRICAVAYGAAIVLYVLVTLTGSGQKSAARMVPSSIRAASRKVNMDLLRNRIEKGRLSDREALYWTTEPFDSLGSANPADTVHYHSEKRQAPRQ